MRFRAGDYNAGEQRLATEQTKRLQQNIDGTTKRSVGWFRRYFPSLPSSSRWRRQTFPLIVCKQGGLRELTVTLDTAIWYLDAFSINLCYMNNELMLQYSVSLYSDSWITRPWFTADWNGRAVSVTNVIDTMAENETKKPIKWEWELPKWRLGQVFTLNMSSIALEMKSQPWQHGGTYSPTWIWHDTRRRRHRHPSTDPTDGAPRPMERPDRWSAPTNGAPRPMGRPDRYGRLTDAGARLAGRPNWWTGASDAAARPLWPADGRADGSIRLIRRAQWWLSNLFNWVAKLQSCRATLRTGEEFPKWPTFRCVISPYQYEKWLSNGCWFDSRAHVSAQGGLIRPYL